MQKKIYYLLQILHYIFQENRSKLQTNKVFLLQRKFFKLHKVQKNVLSILTLSHILKCLNFKNETVIINQYFIFSLYNCSVVKYKYTFYIWA